MGTNNVPKRMEWQADNLNWYPLDLWPGETGACTSLLIARPLFVRHRQLRVELHEFIEWFRILELSGR